MRAQLRWTVAVLLAAMALYAVPVRAATSPAANHGPGPVHVDMYDGPAGSIAPAVTPDTACTTNSQNENYQSFVLNGVTFYPQVGWTRENDCSHWATFVKITASGGWVEALSGGPCCYNAVLEDTSGDPPYAYSIYNQCKPTNTGYTNYFSGSNVPAFKTPLVDAGIGNTCSTHFNVGLQDHVN